MLIKLRLKNFKGFRDAELHLGPLTLLVGTNASGKSNIRDALRFLHGIGRGYNLADIIGEKYVEGGVLQWRGIRGGIREITFRQADKFRLEITFPIKYKAKLRNASYQIEVETGAGRKPPKISVEQLKIEDSEDEIFKFQNFWDLPGSYGRRSAIKFLEMQDFYDIEPLACYQPLLPQIISEEFAVAFSLSFHGYFREKYPLIRELVQATLDALKDIRFLDLQPDALRALSLPGQTILGDRGENLSSVLFNICQDPQRKQALLEWIKELTPMDAQDFEFLDDFTGKILLHLVEENGQRVSAYSASDGTLRFLALLAALLGSEPAKLYFFEELDNGIHPTRLHLLLQLIERKVAEGNIQIVATTHSPQLLRLLSPQSLESASLTYRLPDHADARIKRILDIPDAKRLIYQGDLAQLYESGWLEDAVYFTEEEEMETAL